MTTNILPKKWKFLIIFPTSMDEFWQTALERCKSLKPTFKMLGGTPSENLDENIVQTLDTQKENVKIIENQLQRNIKPGYKDAAEKRNSTRPARRNGAAESPRNLRNHKQRQRQERERCKQVLVVTSTSLQNLFRYSR